MKPRLVKSLIAQNAALIREKQQLIEYFKVVEMVLRTITKNGKDTGVVDLKEMHAMCREMRGILSAYEISTYEKMGTFRAPSKKDLGKMAQADEGIFHGFFHGSAEEMREFFDKMITDLMKNNPPSDNDVFGSEVKFGEDLDEGGYPPSQPSGEDPFGETDVDKPE